MFVPFQARQLRKVCLFWINRRWFLERDLDVTDDPTRQRVSNWLLQEFGYAVPREDDPTDTFTNKVKTLYADRYGSSTGSSVHGGSGRVATICCFQAKGIGVTPLAGAGANWVHSNGCASIEEAVREAIFSEIADAEFPHGAVPVVAILDTGLYFSSPEQNDTRERMRRAIIVRPSVLRLAHAERAPSFNHSLTGYVNSQLHDVQRTKEVVNRWRSQDVATRTGTMPALTLTELARHIGQQVAFGQVHRLFNGGYFSSNLSATGALLDFGGMRALPNWANARNLDHAVGFGDEMKIVIKVLQSLAFYFAKYQSAPTSPIDEATLLAEASDGYTNAFANECLRIWNVHAAADTNLSASITDAMRQYFSKQQNLLVNYKHGAVKNQSWLYDDIIDGASDTTRESSAEFQTLNAIQRALHGIFAMQPQSDKRLSQAWSTAARYLMPRDAIDREQLQKRINHLLASQYDGSNGRNDVFSEFISRTVGMSRRHWPRMPGCMSVQAHVTHEGSTALQCLELVTNQSVLWIEGIRGQGEFRLFGQTFNAQDSEYIGVRCDGVYWTVTIPLSKTAIGLGIALELKDRRIPIPMMQIEYAQPVPWLSGVRSKHINTATA